MPGGLGGLGTQREPLTLSAISAWSGGGHGLVWLLQSGWNHLGLGSQNVKLVPDSTRWPPADKLWELGGDELLSRDIHG